MPPDALHLFDPDDRRGAALSGSRRSPASSATRRRRGPASPSPSPRPGCGGSRTRTARLHAISRRRDPADAGVGGQVRAQPARLARGRARDGARAAGERAAPPVGRRRQRAGRAARAGVRRARARARHRRAARRRLPGRPRARSLDALRSYLATANPLADHPSVRLVEAALRDEERAVEWGRAAAAAVPRRATGPRGSRRCWPPPAGCSAMARRREAPRPSALRRRPAGPRPRRAPRRALRRPVQPVGADRRILRRRGAPGRRAGVCARLQAPARDGRAGVDGADHRRVVGQPFGRTAAS